MNGTLAVLLALAPATAEARFGGGGGFGGGGFHRPAGGFQRLSGGFQRPAGGFQRPAGGFHRPEGLQRPGGGGFQRQPGNFQRLNRVPGGVTRQPAGPTPGAPPGTRFAYGTRFLEPPDDCKDMQRGPIAFEQCNVDWLQPVMQGGTVYYIAVPPPG